jgi:hypothetical protein
MVPKHFVHTVGTLESAVFRIHLRATLAICLQTEKEEYLGKL